jgi:large subunit ribosomal protein L32
MAQEPKRKHSKARKRTRRASIILKSVAFISCSNCSKPTLPHQVCIECGFYKGKSVAPTKAQVTTVK